MENMSTFLAGWNQYMYYGAVVLVIAGVLIFLYHEFKILQIKDYKERYDYVNLHEIKYFLYAVIACVVAGAFIINTVGNDLIVQYGQRWFYVRAGLSACFIIVGYFVFFNLIRIYYPSKLSRRLAKLRSAPRISPEGNTMRLLTEAEEDLHLEHSQIKEEDIQVVDYDVWIDDKTGYKKIEKYIISEQAVECPECGFYTLVIDSEEVGQNPTDSEPGYLIEHLACSYCNHREKKEIVVSQLSANVA